MAASPLLVHWRYCSHQFPGEQPDLVSELCLMWPPLWWAGSSQILWVSSVWCGHLCGEQDPPRSCEWALFDVATFVVSRILPDLVSELCLMWPPLWWAGSSQILWVSSVWCGHLCGEQDPPRSCEWALFDVATFVVSRILPDLVSELCLMWPPLWWAGSSQILWVSSVWCGHLCGEQDPPRSCEWALFDVATFVVSRILPDLVSELCLMWPPLWWAGSSQILWVSSVWCGHLCGEQDPPRSCEWALFDVATFVVSRILPDLVSELCLMWPPLWWAGSSQILWVSSVWCGHLCGEQDPPRSCEWALFDVATFVVSRILPDLVSELCLMWPPLWWAGSSQILLVSSVWCGHLCGEQDPPIQTLS